MRATPRQRRIVKICKPTTKLATLPLTEQDVADDGFEQAPSRRHSQGANKEVVAIVALLAWPKIRK